MTLDPIPDPDAPSPDHVPEDLVECTVAMPNSPTGEFTAFRL
jgi:hypothetical protein